jgi:hypothetical protein
MQSVADQTAAWLRARRVLALELLPLGVAGAVLYALAPDAEASTPEARAAFLGVGALFFAAFVRLVARAVEFLQLDCPRCDREFWIPPSLPFRARCARCGFQPSADAVEQARRHLARGLAEGPERVGP